MHMCSAVAVVSWPMVDLTRTYKSSIGNKLSITQELPTYAIDYPSQVTSYQL